MTIEPVSRRFLPRQAVRLALGADRTLTHPTPLSTHSLPVAVFGIQFQGTDMRGPPTRIRCCVLQCRALEGGGGGGDDDNEGAQPSSLEILDLAFFDNETLLLVMRTLVTSDEEEEEEQGSEFGKSEREGETGHS